MEEFLLAYGREIECMGKHEIEIEKGKGGIKKSDLSILPNCTAAIPCLLISKTRVNTIPSVSTIVSAAKYLGIRISTPNQFVRFARNIVTNTLKVKMRTLVAVTAMMKAST
jgi:hypothetical protein